ncbi:N66 matrix protein-like [Helianthus annuus]|uniref:N66 matrix protein-like n=1 Tax=Helianthus annuus TaxID=4232 RepID=UPI000B8F410E|nr:N66 matrix protein-like [Helianthus annuus]
MVTTSKPSTITEEIDLSVALTEEDIWLNKFSVSEPKKKETHVESSGENKRKFSNFKQGTSISDKKGETSAQAKAKGKGYMGTLHKCNACQLHHEGRCKSLKCESCGRMGHSKETCWVGTGRGGQRGFGNNRGGNRNGNRPQGRNGGNGNRGNFGNQAGNDNRNQNNNQGGNGNGNGNGPGPGCFNCGDLGHFKRECPKLNQAQGRVFNIGAREARQDPNVVTESHHRLYHQ